MRLLSVAISPLALVHHTVNRYCRHPLNMGAMRGTVRTKRLSILRRYCTSFRVAISASMLLRLAERQRLSFAVRDSENYRLGACRGANVRCVSGLLRRRVTSCTCICRRTIGGRSTTCLLPGNTRCALIVAKGFHS